MFVHGQNLSEKESRKPPEKYSDTTSKSMLAEIKTRYEFWKAANLELHGPFLKHADNEEALLRERVRLLNEYKDFIDQQHYAEHFDSRSNLHSSVLEEFLYYLFKDIVAEFGNRTLLGKSHTFKDIFFVAPNYQGMVATPNARIETKDHDFVIGIRVQAILSNEDASASLEGIQPNTEAQQNSELETHTLDVPAVAIECKTYIDKTMLEGAATAATQLKARNPNSLYIVLAEWVKLSDDINLQKYSAIDRTYILRKQKNTDREYRFAPTYVKNPIYADTVNSLFDFVRDHLTSDWEGGIEFGLQRGWL